MNNYQKNVACSFGCKLVCVDNEFSKPFKSYLGEDAIYNFINSMIEESKYCSDVMKKHFNKELKILKTLLNVGPVTMVMLIMMLK